MSYDIVNSKYNGDTVGNYVLEVNVMENAGISRDYLDKQYSYVEDALDQLSDRVPGTLCREYTTDANISCDSVFSEGNQWLDANGMGDGIYLWCMDCNDNPYACCHESGWDGRHQSVSFSNAVSQNHGNCVLGIMEALHPYIYEHSCEMVQALAGGEDDHYLGEIHDTPIGYDDRASPMLGYYYQDVAENGNCDHWENRDGVSTILTTCTEEAIEYSWNHAAGNH